MCEINEKKCQFADRMGLKAMARDKLKSSMVRSSKMKVWILRATTSVLIWTCIVQLTALGDSWGPRILKGWPSICSHDSSAAFNVVEEKTTLQILPPKSEFLVPT